MRERGSMSDRPGVGDVTNTKTMCFSVQSGVFLGEPVCDRGDITYTRKHTPFDPKMSI